MDNSRLPIGFEPISPEVQTDPTTQEEVNRALLTACDNGDESGVEACLAAGADVNAYGRIIDDDWEPDEVTPLILAAMRKRVEIVRRLLDFGTDVEARNELRNMTALMIAAEEGEHETCEALLIKGADVNATDWDGDSALFYGAESGHVSVIQLLMKYDTDTGLRNVDGNTAADYAVRTGHMEVAAMLK
ncbi:ankyrin repeat domain-containing protein [Thermodesulfobacteriota bacterium]